MSEEVLDTTPDDLESTPTEIDTNLEVEATAPTEDVVTTTNTDEAIEYADFAVPDGLTKEDVDSTSERLKPLFEELGLTKAEAQQLIDHELSQAQANTKNQSDAWDSQVQEWQDELKADKKIGGDHFEQSKGLVSTALEKLGTPELSQLFESTGLIQNPEVFRFLHKLGKLTQEDNPGAIGNASAGEKDTIELLYPNQ